MKQCSSKPQFNNKYRLELNSRGAERRKLQRREQSDRREIVRFGYDITTRRFGRDRRKYQDDWQGYVNIR
ncbi:MAG: hypothetical protein LJE85_07625 [Gammaproteobacteria bacterium]|nr:hypothetical protein [Gammaproteobacteria bacterium]